MSETNKPAGKPEQGKPDAKPAPIVALLSNELFVREAGVRLNTFEIVPAAGTPRDHLLRRDFWANVASKLQPGSTIIAFPRDGAWYAELVVWDRGQNWADVSLKGALERPTLGAAPAGADGEFVIKTDPIDGIYIARAANGQKVKTNFPNHADAQRWIVEHQRALRR